MLNFLLMMYSALLAVYVSYRARGTRFFSLALILGLALFTHGLYHLAENLHAEWWASILDPMGAAVFAVLGLGYLWIRD